MMRYSTVDRSVLLYLRSLWYDSRPSYSTPLWFTRVTVSATLDIDTYRKSSIEPNPSQHEQVHDSHRRLFLSTLCYIFRRISCQ